MKEQQLPEWKEEVMALIPAIKVVINRKEKFLEKAKANMSKAEYEQFKKDISFLEEKTASYHEALLDNTLALQSNVNARKRVKVDPYIAGGAAQGIAGLGAGIYAATTAADRNEDITIQRNETQREVFKTDAHLQIVGDKLKASFQKVLDCIRKYDDLNAFYEEGYAIMKSVEEAEKMAKSKAYRKEVNRKNSIYEKALSEMNATRYESAINLFSSISGWKDADRNIEICRQKDEEAKAEAARPENILKTEIARKEAEQKSKQNEKKQKKFALILMLCVFVIIGVAIIVTGVIIPNSKYKEAVALMETGKYDEAYDAFIAMDGYKDSEEKAKDAIYSKANLLLDQEKYVEAHDAFLSLDGHKDSSELADKIMNEIIPSVKYEDAVALIDKGKYSDAYKALIALDGYKDSAKIAESIYSDYIKSASVGDYITFGLYPQGKDEDEAIEWKILSKKSDSVLVMSKFALDCIPYHDTYTFETITWNNCSLRKWLNNDFLDKAFSKKEKTMIKKVSVSADKNPYYDTNPGKATMDKIFLLSVNEAEKYMKDSLIGSCTPTDYAETKGIYVKGGSSICWLRTPGEYQGEAAGISTGGGIAKGISIRDNETGVRPAMWIELD